MNYITDEKLSNPKSLYVKLCKSCGREYNERYDYDECYCDNPNLVLIDYNPVEFFKDYKNTQNKRDKIYQKTLKLTDEEYSALKAKWSEQNEEIAKQEWERKLEEGRRASQESQPHKVRCPYCNSENVKRISTINRVMSVGVFGLGSKKVGKQWHCNYCKSDF